MKLITEQNFNSVNFLKEGKEGEKQDYFIEGIFMQGDMKNRNGRMYPVQTLLKEVNRYDKEYIQKNRAYGELGHPSGPTINLDRVSHMIKELKQDGSHFVGKAKIMDTPMGHIVKNLMDEGCMLGVSSRGMGTLKERNGVAEVQNDFMLATAGDIVADPSAPDAFVNGVMEGTEWIYDVASGNWRAMEVVDKIQEIGQKSAKSLNENTIRAFQQFLNTL